MDEQTQVTTKPAVFLIDDHEDIRRGLRRVLMSEGIQVEEFASAQEFLNTYETHRSGCVVSDVVMPGMTGMELQAALNQRNVQIPMVLMSAHGDIAITKQALKNGAVDFLEKPVSNAELISAVHEAFAQDASQRQQQRTQERQDARLACLTRRERQILNLLLSGLSNQDVSEKLTLSPRTIETHRANILRKMHASSLYQLSRQLPSLSA